jgi:regulator of RNase E activity RraA
MTPTHPHQKLIDAFSEFSTSTISDACDKLGIAAGCLGISAVSKCRRMVGTAYTVRYVPVGETKGTVGDYIDEVRPGDVVVLDNQGRTDCTVWGDILTVYSRTKDIAGTLIEGVCRDLDGIDEHDYPLFARGVFMMTGKDRVMVDGTQVTVSVGNRQVRPDDMIVGDASGVVVVPKERAEEVLEIARAIEAAENAIMEAVRGGASIAQARRAHGYHTLQTKG